MLFSNNERDCLFKRYIFEWRVEASQYECSQTKRTPGVTAYTTGVTSTMEANTDDTGSDV